MSSSDYYDTEMSRLTDKSLRTLVTSKIIPEFIGGVIRTLTDVTFTGVKLRSESFGLIARWIDEARKPLFKRGRVSQKQAHENALKEMIEKAEKREKEFRESQALKDADRDELIRRQAEQLMELSEIIKKQK